MNKTIYLIQTTILKTACHADSRCYGKPMDSKLQVKKTSVTGGTGCKQPGKKKAKERKSSRLNVFIYSAGGKSLSCYKLVYNYDELGTSAAWTNISSMVVRVQVRIF
ncbi:hypothetical protein AVEN_91830-1 [Araneus ventricosus]|uniref:Uncharacterized protein n=1 Tax=Araneus ventricosus TaxID=182803 RepID=A0A4Y2K793_ARAVE|nr:hypothetical protein AVEN_91830-1 [Araneus ventricosus]